jgi:hypothetical protein
MIQVSIKKQDQITNQASFPTMEEAQAWLTSHEGMGTFGQKAQTIQQEVEISPAVIESQEVLDENGESFDPPQFQDVEISPAQHEMQEIHIPGYVVEIEDISDELEQKQINAEAQAFLDSTDWMVIRAAERGEELSLEFKAERQAARERIIK